VRNHRRTVCSRQLQRSGDNGGTQSETKTESGNAAREKLARWIDVWRDELGFPRICRGRHSPTTTSARSLRFQETSCFIAAIRDRVRDASGCNEASRSTSSLARPPLDKRHRVFQSRDRKRQIPRGFEYRFLLSSPPRGFIRQGGQVEYEISLHGIDIMVSSDEKEPTTMDMEASTVEKSLGRGRKTAIVDGLRFCSRPTNVRKTMGPGRAHSSRLHAVARCVARQLRARSALSSPDEGGVCANTFSDRMDIEVGARHNVAVSENVIPRATFRGIVRSRNSFMVLRHRAETHRWSIDGCRDSRDRNERRRESVRAKASSGGRRLRRRRADERLLSR